MVFRGCYTSYYEEITNLNLGVAIMRKFLLVLFVGLVVAMNLYGIVNTINDKVVDDTEMTMTVYME